MEEVNAVMELVGELLKSYKYTITQTDIGIVTPYKLQCKRIKLQCDKKGLKDIRIGSAEAFQGQERKVMIISTVQSSQKTLGQFLKNPQVRCFYHTSLSLYEISYQFSEIQCNDYTCKKPSDCRWKSAFTVTRLKLVDFHRILLQKQMLGSG